MMHGSTKLKSCYFLDLFLSFLNKLLHDDCINIFNIFMFTSYEIPDITVLGKCVCVSLDFQIACIVAFTLNQACTGSVTDVPYAL